MKVFWLVFFTGLVLLYFFVKGLKVEFFTLEIFLHTLYYFFSGFVILAGWCFYKAEKHLKVFVILVLGIIFVDDLSDYVRGVNDITTEMLIYNLYLMLWGALSGVAFIAYWRRRIPSA
jgi:hypothetical protein